MNGEWRPIPSWPEYEASSTGFIRSPSGHILTAFPNKGGYLRVPIGGRRGRRALVSVLVCEAFHGPRPSLSHQVAHGNGVRSDNRADNVAWRTRTENYEDQIAHGTSKRGEGHHLAKFSNRDIARIREEAITAPRRALTERYAISGGHLSQIVNRKIWAHV